MSENFQPQGEFYKDAARRNYLEMTTELSRRWMLYEHIEKPRNIHEEAYIDMDADPDGSLLDVGCSKGDFLMDIRLDHMHTGNLVGMDIDERLFIATTALCQETGIQPPELVVGRAEELPFADNSFDYLTAFFVLYHASDPEKALSEFRRVLKPQGKLVVATSGGVHKFRHRSFEKEIAGHLGIEAPPDFAESFNATVAKKLLPKYFDVKTHKVLESDFIISKAKREEIYDKYEAYRDSLISMKSSFEPEPIAAEFLRTVDSVVWPQIMMDLAEKDFFVDHIERHYFICKNSKT